MNKEALELQNIKMSELWKQCANWLCLLEVLPSNHRITWPDATIQDLAYTLRDGTLLCHIASSIDPVAIDMSHVSQRPQMAQFLCLKNIRHFLNACTSFFALKETDLFQPSMLYDYTDFARVLHTLSKLSNCAKSKSKGIMGFPQHVKAPSEDEEQIYRTLEDLVNEDNYEEFYYRHQGAAGVYGGRSSRQYYTALEQEEDIYEDLCSFKSSSSRKMQKELNLQPKEKRDYCIKELVETEGNYVDVLNMLRKHFIRPISAMKENDKRLVFMNLKDLGETHAAFYQEILESVTGKSRTRIGDIFLEFKERFLKYGDYCCALPTALEVLDTLLNKHENIRDEVTTCELAANEGRFRLRDLLAVPMQRILKYHLLLRQLMSNTVSTHEEFHSIQKAYEAMLDVSDYINEVKRDSEKLLIIKDIQSSITDWNMPEGTELKDYGRLRKDSELKIQRHGANEKTKVRYVFLFDKVVLMCKATRGDHYTFKHSEKLADFKVQDVPVRTLRLGRESRWGHSFMLVHVQSKNAYTMFAKTEEDKNKWIAAVREALDNVYPSQRHNSTHEATMFTFKVPTSCDYCHKLLKGLFYQGYRCDKCSRSMHKECIPLLTKCGASFPALPALPPRPPSLLPTSTNPLSNRFSTCSLDESVSSEAALLNRQSSLGSIFAAQHLQHQSFVSDRRSSNPDYINTNMEGHTWFVGPMERDQANARLADFPVCTFLVRCRVQNGEKLGYALSLKTLDDVKHMKICSNSDSSQFFLSDTRKFPSVVELVSWYSRNSLKESFSGLDTNLRFSVGELFIVEATFDFEPMASEKTLLPLRCGERVTVIDKAAGDDQGWWKAYNGFKVGFIPKDYVSPVLSEDDRSAVTTVTEEVVLPNQIAAAPTEAPVTEDPEPETVAES